jgi:hypothetical protein
MFKVGLSLDVPLVLWSNNMDAFAVANVGYEFLAFKKPLTGGASNPCVC